MWKNFLSLLYPSSCLICNRVLHVPENLLCLTCYSDLPKTPLKHSILDNSTMTDFSGSLALFEYNHSGIKKLIHQLKFDGNYKIGNHSFEWNPINYDKGVYIFKIYFDQVEISSERVVLN